MQFVLFCLNNYASLQYSRWKKEKIQKEKQKKGGGQSVGARGQISVNHNKTTLSIMIPRPIFKLST
jgi:hypothetical protein